MSSVLDYYGQYNPESTMNWDGYKSNKFGRTRKYISPRDTIRTSMQMPNYQYKSGRKHYDQQLSPQKQFRSSVKPINTGQHWHLRASSKKIVQINLTAPHPRRQKRHLTPLILGNDKYAGLRTFYNLGLKNDTKQYSIQDKMQRKSRIDALQLRKTFFQNQSQSMMLNSSTRY